MAARVSLLTRLCVAAVFAAVLTAAVVLAILGSAEARRGAMRRVDEVSRTLVLAQLLERHMVDIETGLRGYVPTGDRVFLAPLVSGRRALPGEFDALDTAVRRDPLPPRRAREAESAAVRYLRTYATPLAAHPGAITGARLDRITRVGKQLFDGVRARFDAFDRSETAVLRRAEASASSADRLFSAVALAGVAGLLTALMWFVTYTGRLVVRPLRRVIRACAALASGERDVSLAITGPSELRELARGFNAMADRLAANEENLARRATVDPLTGLLNRRGFETALGSQRGFNQRYGARGVLLLIDLDNFKAVNDTLGHGRGDDLLIACAGALAGRVRETDSLARIGGDEFAVILPAETVEQARAVAAHLIAAVARSAATVTGELVGPRVTASIGIAEFRDGEGEGEVLERADAAMYEAKAAGRNTYAIAAAPELVA